MFEKNKEWVKHDIAHIMIRPGQEYASVFDLENEMGEIERVDKVKRLFVNEINKLTDNVLTRTGIIDLHKKDNLFLLPAVKQELGLN